MIASFLLAWEWIKKHAVLCVALLGAFVSVLVGFLLGRKHTVVEIQPTHGPSSEQQRLDAASTNELKVLEEVKNLEQQAIKIEHTSEMDAQVIDLQKRVPVLVHDADELNKQLLDVGKKVRGDDG